MVKVKAKDKDCWAIWHYAGSYSVLGVCKATGRRCICCDIEFGTVWNEEMNLHKSN